MSPQRQSQFIELGSGARGSKELILPTPPGQCLRLNLVRYMSGDVRTSVPTNVTSLYALTPYAELAGELPTGGVAWQRDRRFWLLWTQTLHIGSTSDEAMVENNKDIPIPGGLDLVGSLWFCVLNVNWNVNVHYSVEVFYEVRPVGEVERMQLEVKDRARLRQ